MKLQMIAMCMTASCCAIHAAADSAAIDYDQSSLGFEVLSGDRVITSVFDQWSANIETDHNVPEAATYRVLADIGRVRLSDNIAQTMVPTAAWLAAAEFPVAEFESAAVTKVGYKSYRGTGAFLLRGVTAPIELAVVMHDASDITVAYVTGQLDRTDFSIGSAFGTEIVDHLVTLNATVFSQ